MLPLLLIVSLQTVSHEPKKNGPEGSPKSLAFSRKLIKGIGTARTNTHSYTVGTVPVAAFHSIFQEFAASQVK